MTVGTVVVFQGALRFYFAQEDFRDLAVKAGVYPRHAQLWRYLSVQTFMDVFYPFFHDRSLPYHAVGLALHSVNASLLFVLLSKRVSRAAALIGSSFFAVHPALFTALYWLSARADILAAFFALATFVLALRSGRERWLAVPAFACALLSKESVLPLPAIIWVWERWRAGREPGRSEREKWWTMTATLAGMSLLYGFYLAQAGVGVAPSLGAQQAYAMDLRAAFGNLLTYVGWTVDLAMVRPGMRFVDSPNPELFGLAILTLLIAGLLASWTLLRRRGWLFAAFSYVLLLIPVLPFENHTYHYYLYLPLMAAGACAALLGDAVLAFSVRQEKPKGGKNRGQFETMALTGAVALACWCILTWNGARLVTEMERRPSPVYPGLRGDPIVDRSLIAERAIDGLKVAAIPSGAEMVFIMRERLALIARIARGSGESSPPAQEVYPETNVRTALFDGVGVRALFPAVDSVMFATTLGQPMTQRRYAVYAPTGETEVFDAASLDSLLRSEWVTRW